MNVKRAALHKSVEGCSSPFLGQTYPTASVNDLPADSGYRHTDRTISCEKVRRWPGLCVDSERVSGWLCALRIVCFGGPDTRTVFVTSICGQLLKGQTDRVGWAMYP